MGGLRSRTAMPPLGTGRALNSGVFGIFGGSQRHDRATTGMGRACLSAIFWFLVVMGWHGHAITGTGRASLSGQGGQKISPFSHLIRTKTYKTNKNNTKKRNKND